MIFPDVNIKEIKKKLNVEELAINNGGNNLPSQHDEQLDAVQGDITHHFIELLDKAKASALSYLQTIKKNQQKIEEDADASTLENFPADAQQAIDRVLAQSKEDLISKRKKERRMLANRKAFLALNNINREPIYPDSKIFHWALVISAIVAESIANSYFFAQAGNFGLIGGALQAFLVSASNIGLSLLVGVIILPLMNHVKPKMNNIAYATTVGYGCLIIFFNLATAHYRALLEIDPGTAIFEAIPHLLDSPLAIDNFDAWVLFVIGIIFSLFALIKGYTSDDRYPGYGKIDRLFKEALSAYEDAKKELIKKINKEIDIQEQNLQSAHQKIHQYFRNYKSYLGEAESTIRKYDQFVKLLTDGCNNILQSYRNTNLKVRSNPAPSYFQDNIFSFDEESRLPPISFEEEKKFIDDLGRIVDDHDNNSPKAKKMIQKINSSTLANIEKFYVKIEEEADKNLDDERAISQ